jgi:hypothetical protein
LEVEIQDQFLTNTEFWNGSSWTEVNDLATATRLQELEAQVATSTALGYRRLR